MSNTARVTITVEVDLKQPWGDASTLGELKKAAAREAIDSITRAIQGATNTMRIIGKPEVKAILSGGMKE